MQSKNSGYYGYSYSVRSHQARQASRLPMTLAKKELQTLLKQEGFKFSLKDCQLALEDIGNYGEWHHTGKLCNRTPHYNVAITFASIVYGGEDATILTPCRQADGKIATKPQTVTYSYYLDYTYGNEFTFSDLEAELLGGKTLAKTA